MKYAFILGTNPALSLAELLAKLKNAKLEKYSQEVAIFEIENIDKNLIDELGGTIKIIELLDSIASKTYSNDLIVDRLAKMIQKLKQKDSKFRFGLSLYELADTRNIIKQISRQQKNICIKLKQELRNYSIKLAFLNSNEKALSSASVIKNKLMDENASEAVIISDNESVYIGKTVGVQNIDLYTYLDVNRPSRDLISGTTPPKLAKIMVNLASINSPLTTYHLPLTTPVLLDPFCGSGTFLQEMALLGYKNLIGSDISSRAIQSTQKNLDWLAEKRKLDINLKLFESDAKDLDKIIDKKSIDAIISEVYLGPALLREAETEKLNEILKQLNNLYQGILPALCSVVKSSGLIILALPIFKTGNGYKTLALFDNLEQFGLKIINPVADLKENWIKNYQTSRGTIIYHRPDQLVWREIIVLNKN